MTRLVPVTVLVVLMAASGVVGAQGNTLPGGVTVNFDKLYIHENGSKEAQLPETQPDSLLKYFNYAHCQCGKAMPGFVEATFEYLTLASSATPTVSQPLQIWVGASCNTDAQTRNTNCHPITNQSPTVASIQGSNNTRIVIPIYDAMNPEPSRAGMDCQQRVLSATVWGLADTKDPPEGALDYSTSKAVTTDAQPPPIPTSFRAVGGDNAIDISWSASIDTTDVFGFQALCARADDDSAGKTTGRPSPRYMTTQTLCDLPQAVLPQAGVAIPIPANSPDAGSTVTLPAGMRNLDPTFLCGESISPTTTSLRIEGLENDTPYKVAIVAVDKYQNVAGTFFTTTVTPVPSTDFWEDIQGRDSDVEGGLCLLAETYGDDSGLTRTLRAFRDDTLGNSRFGRWLARAYYATLGRLGGAVHGSLALRILAGILLAPAVVFALLWHWLTLPGLLGLIAAAALWRRRGLLVGHCRRAVPFAAGLAIVVLGARSAHAGGGFQPYWEDTDPSNDSQPMADEPENVRWHVGLRGGPYVPDVDDQFGMSPGPYQQMFGSRYHVLMMLDVDRVLWSGFGQLGVGLSAGYWQKTARAFTIESKPEDNPRARASDRNAFRLVPTQLSATYRFTWLDDEHGIPIVPYARAGLAYYVWWVSGSNGVAKACADGTVTPGCSTTKALGASLGVQGSIGLAIRAERIDASAAISMRQSGIQHAGVYAELSLAKVDGFGSDKKLSVGDRTWFAGVDFEF